MTRSVTNRCSSPQKGRVSADACVMEHPLKVFRYCPACGSERFGVNDRYSKRCGRCGFVYYANPKAATVAVIVNGRGEILVCRRADDPAKGTLDLPGGFTDIGETAEEGVRREVREETGLTVTETEFLFSLPNVYLFSGMEVHTMDLFFLCRVDDGVPPSAHDDAAEAMFVPLSELDVPAFGLRSVREGVARIVAGGLGRLLPGYRGNMSSAPPSAEAISENEL